MQNSSCLLKGFFRTLSVFCTIGSLYILGNETALIFSKSDLISLLINKCANSVMANFILSYTFLTILVGFAFFTIFKLKISDYMQMVPKHTDVVTMSSFSGFFSKLIAVGCFNFMTLANQLDSSAPFHTSNPTENIALKVTCK